MEIPLPALVAFASLAVAIVGALLADQRSKTRSEVVGSEAKNTADRLGASVSEIALDLSQLREATSACSRDLDRLRESKAEAVVVTGLEKAVQDLRVEILRQLEKMDRHLEKLDDPTPRRRRR
jgi:hypothetical protein